MVGVARAQETIEPPAEPLAGAAEVCRYIKVEALDRYDAVLDVEARPTERAGARFADIMSRWSCERWPVTSRNRQVEVTGGTLHAHGAPATVRLTQQALAQLLAEDVVVRTRIHCSVLTLPRAAATAEGLKAGKPLIVDAATLTRLARVAMKQRGALRNLQEVAVAPLRPIAIEDIREGDTSPPLCLRTELVPLSRTEALLGLHAVRGSLPTNLVTVPPTGKALLASPVLHLFAGSTTVVALEEAETTTVLVVRCADVGPNVTESSSPAPSRRPQ